MSRRRIILGGLEITLYGVLIFVADWLLGGAQP